MIGHETIGVDLDAIGVLERGQGVEVALEVARLGEDHLPVVPALHDVVRVIGQDGASQPWHRGLPCPLFRPALFRRLTFFPFSQTGF